MRDLAILAAALAASCVVVEGDPQPPPPPEREPWGAPISGGTMIVTRDDVRAVVADSDRDRIVIVDLDAESVHATIELPAGSEPGRVIEDAAGRIHVALRGSGELLTITGDTHAVRPICGEPRGLASQGDVVHVACATGELVTIPAGGGDPTRVVRIERDLRDVLGHDIPHRGAAGARRAGRDHAARALADRASHRAGGRHSVRHR
jgi:hypothetical protein